MGKNNDGPLKNAQPGFSCTYVLVRANIKEGEGYSLHSPYMSAFGSCFSMSCSKNFAVNEMNHNEISIFKRIFLLD